MLPLAASSTWALLAVVAAAAADDIDNACAAAADDIDNACAAAADDIDNAFAAAAAAAAEDEAVEVLRTLGPTDRDKETPIEQTRRLMHVAKIMRDCFAKTNLELRDPSPQKKSV